MNNVVLIGRLAKDPEMNDGGSTTVTKFTIAVDRIREGADFIRIVVFGQQANNCYKYLSKGRLVAVRGHISTGSYKDKEGRTVYTTDIVGDEVEFLGGKPAESEPREEPRYYNDLF